MEFLKVTTVILFVLLTFITLKLHPEMHQPMIIEDENFKLTRISDTITRQYIPTAPAKQHEKAKEIKVQEQEAVSTNRYVETQTPKRNEKRKHVNIDNTQNNVDESQIELLQRIIEQSEKQENSKSKTEEPIKLEKPREITPPKTENKNPYMTEQEEIIAWNRWRSNLQNQIMRDSQIDYAPLGTIFLFTFVVDKFGNISNIKVECSNPNYMDIARTRVKPAIANLQKKPILNFPKGTQRTSTVVTGIFLIGTEERYSTPNDFSDYERVVY